MHLRNDLNQWRHILDAEEREMESLSAFIRNQEAIMDQSRHLSPPIEGMTIRDKPFDIGLVDRSDF